ncbi:PTS sugar transporter subunit IIB [Clostridium sp. JN-9]|uniref:PTS sugar transporter subunit IIB n=1 Tax=Clostridium sp. JN-9 TaxID=2507159 RepID=UPI000FFE2E7D|nr:PTS sugar transporter subunit IIB [Clostridium sp. JN-9]QAT39110.1 PTS galactitol transporter subunit IIB [Clostridium sp. JN-9]
MKRIIVACGSGVATSQAVASKISRLLEDDNINAAVDAVDIKSLESVINQCDIYVSIVPTNKDEFKVPVLSGIPFLTGIGMDQEYEKLKELLKK